MIVSDMFLVARGAEEPNLVLIEWIEDRLIIAVLRIFNGQSGISIGDSNLMVRHLYTAIRKHASKKILEALTLGLSDLREKLALQTYPSYQAGHLLCMLVEGESFAYICTGSTGIFRKNKNQISPDVIMTPNNYYHLPVKQESFKFCDLEPFFSGETFSAPQILTGTTMDSEVYVGHIFNNQSHNIIYSQPDSLKEDYIEAALKYPYDSPFIIRIDSKSVQNMTKPEINYHYQDQN